MAEIVSTPSGDPGGGLRVVALQRDLVAIRPGSSDGWINSLDLLLHRLHLQGIESGKTPDWDTLQISITPNEEGEGLRVTARVEVF